MTRCGALTWRIDPDIAFLNHGSFGACPGAVLAAQAELRERMERRPVRYFLSEMLPAIDEARRVVAAFVGADPEGFVFVTNATHGVNAVVRGLSLEPGDELLVTDHGYAACSKALRFVAERAGAEVVVAKVPFFGVTPDLACEAVLGAVTGRTRFALIDHVTSPTAMVLPVERIVPALQERGVTVMVDGAHAPGMLPLAVDALGADFYTANCHKWLCAPKGAGFLWAAPAHRDTLHPLAISHGHGMCHPSKPRLHLEFDWPGTFDSSPWLCVPAAIDAVGAMHPDGWDGVRAHNHRLALRGRDLLCEALGVEPPVPDAMIGSMASIPAPDGEPGDLETPLYRDPLQEQILQGWGIEVPLTPWPAPPKRLIRISAQLYNRLPEYARLADALRELRA